MQLLLRVGIEDRGGYFTKNRVFLLLWKKFNEKYMACSLDDIKKNAFSSQMEGAIFVMFCL